MCMNASFIVLKCRPSDVFSHVESTPSQEKEGTADVTTQKGPSRRRATSASRHRRRATDSASLRFPPWRRVVFGGDVETWCLMAMAMANKKQRLHHA